jgi:hypothetical protein
MAPKKDFTQVAHAVFVQATEGVPVKTPKQIAGRQGGLKGGKARMDALNQAQRVELAMKGVQARKKAPAGKAGALITKK